MIVDETERFGHNSARKALKFSKRRKLIDRESMVRILVADNGVCAQSNVMLTGWE